MLKPIICVMANPSEGEAGAGVSLCGYWLVDWLVGHLEKIVRGDRHTLRKMFNDRQRNFTEHPFRTLTDPPKDANVDMIAGYNH